MNWHTVTVAPADLERLVLAIRRAGGCVEHSFRTGNGFTVMYSTTSPLPLHPA